eukprot:12418051-Karenia_brevis.AAC.1
MAAIAKSRVKIVKVQPNTEDFVRISQNGRVQMTGIILPSNVLLIVVNIYGWTNGHISAKSSQRTNDMLQIVFQELQSQPVGPRVILGDLNADPQDIPSLQDQLDQSHFIDI